MVSAINNFSDKTRNGTIGAGIGVLGAGSVGYLSSSILDKNNNFKDEFIHKLVLKYAADDPEQKVMIGSFKKYNNLSEKSPISSVRKLLNDTVSKFSKLNIDTGLIEKEDIEVIRKGDEKSVRKLFQGVKDVVLEYYEATKYEVNEFLGVVFDKSKKKFVSTLEDNELSDEGVKFLDDTKKLVNKMKYKRTAIFAGVGALVAGVASFLLIPTAASSDKIQEKAETSNSN